ncbi:endonuclease domain-containing protein [Undibacterium sp. Di26W]|uniref:endonuclease domain-containing protein n=1 Tax=Undibacterium sp. Di26W TaxID=3413035 RepID=UPI003BF17A6D
MGFSRKILTLFSMEPHPNPRFCRRKHALRNPDVIPLKGKGFKKYFLRKNMKNATSETLITTAKVLRKNMTDAEKKLWQGLRGEQLGVKFRRQYPFQYFVLDFVCLEKRLVIEVDGGQHTEAQTYDMHRTEVLKKAGFTVLRFWNNQVLSETSAVMEEIWRHVNKEQS